MVDFEALLKRVREEAQNGPPDARERAAKVVSELERLQGASEARRAQAARFHRNSDPSVTGVYVRAAVRHAAYHAHALSLRLDQLVRLTDGGDEWLRVKADEVRAAAAWLQAQREALDGA